MKAIYLPDIEHSDQVVIEGPKFHHLVHVSRAKVGDRILILNGKGLKSLCTLDKISKRNAVVQVNERSLYKKPFDLTLALCIPKRDALDLCLKQAVEIGVTQVYLVDSDFCVNKQVRDDRIDRLIESAMEQANNPYRPSYSKIGSLQEIPFDKYDKNFCLTSQEDSSLSSVPSKGEKLLILIGPEGGFSAAENRFLDNISNLQKIKLQTHILRTPTAVSVGCGLLLATDM